MMYARSITGDESVVLLALVGVLTLLVRKLERRRIHMPVIKSRYKRNQRKLGRGQFPGPTSVLVTPSVATTTVTLTYNVPVVVTDTPDFEVAGKTVTGFTVVSPTVVHLTLNASGAGAAWTQGASDPNVRSYQGGYVAAATGTFP